MAILKDPEARYWRTDLKRGRGVYALISNDVKKPSEYDPLVGVMEKSELAELVVDMHNAVLAAYGRNHWRKALGVE